LALAFLFPMLAASIAAAWDYGMLTAGPQPFSKRIATVVSDGVDLVPTGRCDMGLARTGKIGYAYGQETAEVKTHMDGR